MIKYCYKKLYTSTNPDKQNLNDYIYRTKLESKVNQEDMNVCDGQLSVEECTEAIFKMKLNKSPGIDGLTVKIYRTFWESIKYLIVFILNKCHEDRQSVQCRWVQSTKYNVRRGPTYLYQI